MKKQLRTSCHLLLLAILTYKSHKLGSFAEPYAQGLELDWMSLLLPKELQQLDTDRSWTIFSLAHAKQHVHTVVENYYMMPRRSLAECRTVSSSWPLLYVSTRVNRTKYSLSDPAAWPLGLRSDSSHLDTRIFFESLYKMELALEIETTPQTLIFQWIIHVSYDFSSQAQLRVKLNAESTSPKLLVFVDSYRWIVLALLVLYQVLLTLEYQSVSRFWFTFMTSSNFLLATCDLLRYFNAPWTFAFGFACAMQWVSLLCELESNTRYRVLALTLKRGLPDVLEFLVGVLPIFIAYVIFGTVFFGAKARSFETMGTTATTLFAIVNGDAILATFNELESIYGQIYLYSYIILFTYAVLMVCIGIIENAFFSIIWGDIVKH